MIFIDQYRVQAAAGLNLINYSQEVDNAYWTKVNATITANDTTAPDGTLTADKIVDNSTSGRHDILASVAKSAVSTNYTFSFYAKADTLARFIIGLGYHSADPTNGMYMVWDGTWTGGVEGSGYTLVSSGFSADANGFTRYWVKITSNNHSFLGIDFLLNNASGSLSYSGSGQGLWVWGFDLKEGHTLSAYVKTP